MTIQYNRDTDTLTVSLGPETYEAYSYDSGDFEIILDDREELVTINIANASQFIQQALEAGVPAAPEKTALAPEKTGAAPEKTGMVWYDADSSMISAFGYNEAAKILEVAFHTTGVYRYFDVPRDVFEGLRDAESKGSYMQSHIIDRYPNRIKRRRSRR